MGMSAEFVLSFDDRGWYASHPDALKRQITRLETFSSCVGAHEFRLVGTEPRGADAWCYDVRLFLEDDRVFLEISAHPASIEADLAQLFGWVRSCTGMSVDDEDGAPSGW